MTGRPTDYTPELAATICEALADGSSIPEACAAEGMPHPSTVHRWLGKHDEFAKLYRAACELRAEAMLDEIIEIADDSSGDFVDTESGATKLNSEFVQRSKLRVDTRKWAMSKLAPKRFGDKVTTEVSGPDGGPVETRVYTNRDRAKAIAALLARVKAEKAAG